MNRLTYTLALLLLGGSSAVAATQSAQWTRTWPPLEPTHVDVAMQSALDGWLAASDGVLRHTTNGGVLWTSTSVPTTSIAAVDAKGSRVWAAGTGLFRSLDGGQTWTQTNADDGLRDVFFVSTNAGWAVGVLGRVLASTDGGASWTASTLNATSATARAVQFLSSTTGFVVGDGGTHQKSIDGGLTWTPIAVPTSNDLSDVFYADTSRGWIAAGDRVLKTTDGGATWQSLTLPPGARAERLSVLGANWIWTTGSSDSIAYSSDAGATWTVQFTSGGFALLDVAFGDLANGIACGVDGRAYRTVDGGVSWSLVLGGGGSSQTPLISDVTNVGSDQVWATTTEASILRSTDGGLTWTEMPAALSGTIYRALDFWDAQTGYAVGERQGFYPTIAWTHDGGQTWNPTYHLGMYDFFDIDAIGPQTAIACTDSYIWRTTDAGLTWSNLLTTPLSSYFAADFVDSNRGWIVGYDIFSTVDGGLTWTHRLSSPVAYRDVSFADALNGWAVGDLGAILHTTDGGLTWTAQTANTSSWLQDVEAISATQAWVCGEGGVVLRTDDRGVTWVATAPQDIAGAGVYGASFVSSDLGWIASYYPNPGIWRREPSSCTWQSYCQGKQNSAGKVAQLEVFGAPSYALGSIDVHVFDAVPNKAGILILSKVGAAAAPFLGATLCVAPPIVRLPTQFASASGDTSYSIAIDTTMIGASQWYQFWQRDPQLGDGTGATLSNAATVAFCP